MNLGGGEIVLIVILALVFLGPKRLPEVARQVGRAVAELRRVSRDFEREVRTAVEPFERDVRSAVEPFEHEMRHASASPEAGPQESPSESGSGSGESALEPSRPSS